MPLGCGLLFPPLGEEATCARSESYPRGLGCIAAISGSSRNARNPRPDLKSNCNLQCVSKIKLKPYNYNLILDTVKIAKMFKFGILASYPGFKFSGSIPPQALQDCILLHRCNLKILAKSRFGKSAIFVKFQQTFCKCCKSCEKMPTLKISVR